MKTKILKLVIIVCIAIIPLLSLNAQSGNYSLMTRGQRLPFDTAVAVNIVQYRAETMKFDLCDSLITALSHIVDNQNKQISILEGRVSNLQEFNSMFESEIARKALVNNNLLIEYNRLSKAYDKERTWFKRNGKWVYIGIGFAAGAVITHYIIN